MITPISLVKFLIDVTSRQAKCKAIQCDKNTPSVCVCVLYVLARVCVSCQEQRVREACWNDMCGHVCSEASCLHQVLPCGSDSLAPWAAGIPRCAQLIIHFCLSHPSVPAELWDSLSCAEMKITAMWNGIVVGCYCFTEGEDFTPVIFNQHRSLGELRSDVFSGLFYVALVFCSVSMCAYWSTVHSKEEEKRTFFKKELRLP